jgi:hypothetical protein
MQFALGVVVMECFFLNHSQGIMDKMLISGFFETMRVSATYRYPEVKNNLKFLKID